MITTQVWCRNGNTVTKFIKYDKKGCEQSIRYSDWLRGIWRTEWNCRGDEAFRFVMCAPNWDKVLVESFEDPENPGQRISVYTNIITGQPWTWDPDDLDNCWGEWGEWEKYDIQTKDYCDEWQQIYGTMVFDVSGSWMPTLVGTIRSDRYWNPHTPSDPIPWLCGWAWSYNTQEIFELTSDHVFPANTYHSIALTIMEWPVNVTVGSWLQAQVVSDIEPWLNIQYEATWLLDSAITIDYPHWIFDPIPVRKVIVTTIR